MYAFIVVTFAVGSGCFIGGIVGEVRNEVRPTYLPLRIELSTTTDYIGFGIAFLVAGVASVVLFLLRKRIGGGGTGGDER